MGLLMLAWPPTNKCLQWWLHLCNDDCTAPQGLPPPPPQEPPWTPQQPKNKNLQQWKHLEKQCSKQKTLGQLPTMQSHAKSLKHTGQLVLLSLTLKALGSTHDHARVLQHWFNSHRWQQAHHHDLCKQHQHHTRRWWTAVEHDHRRCIQTIVKHYEQTN